MKRILLLVFFICLLKPVIATTIVIYITPGFVILAADSKGLYTNAKTGKEQSVIVTKIFKSGSFYFALSGIVSDAARSFDVANVVNGALTKEPGIEAAIRKLTTGLQSSLIKYLAYNKKHHPALFKKDLAIGTYVTSVGIVGLKDSRPYAHIVGFKVMDGKKLKIKVEEESYAVDSVADRVFYLGKTAAISRYMDTLQQADEDPARFVDKLINLQMAQTPRYVGPPVDMIKITPAETQWIRRKPSCPIEFK